MYTAYLIDHEYLVDTQSLHATMGHLLVFNPGESQAELKITLFFEDKPPIHFPLTAPAKLSTETNYERWPIQPGVRFALMVESSQPVVCQSTNGWNNTANNYVSGAKTLSPHGVRECAKSYLAITQLSKDWYLPDGIVIDLPKEWWVRESEWAVILNPNDTDAIVEMNLHFDEIMAHPVHVPAQRLKCVLMDDIARRNQHYGVHFHSSIPVAVQWLRAVNWNTGSELMTYWSVPCCPSLPG